MFWKKCTALLMALSVSAATFPASTFASVEKIPDDEKTGEVSAVSEFTSEERVSEKEITPINEPVQTIAIESVELNSTNFPDTVFLDYLEQYNTNRTDSILDAEEIAEITDIDLNGLGVKSLQGIQYFKNLKYLSCDNNQLTNLDLNSLDNLISLRCENNQLTSLDLRNLVKLQELWCSGNQLTSLDLSNSKQLTYLKCQDNQLTNLTLSGLTELDHLYCDRNRLTNLDLTGLESLLYFTCAENPLVSLDLTGLTKLDSLTCGSVEYKLESLVLKGLSGLSFLQVYNTKLTSLDLSDLKNLERLDFSNSDITSLDLTGLNHLTEISCNGNAGLKNLDLTGLTNLEEVDCSDNSLKSLILGSHPKLNSLICNGNQLESLDLSGLTSLTTVDCNHNQLSDINLTGVTGLTKLNCENNYLIPWLAKQDFSKFPNLELDQEYQGVLLNSDYFPDEAFRKYLIDLSNNYNHDYALDYTEMENLTSISLYNETDETGLGVKSLDGIEYLKNVETINCQNNDITSLDLSGLANLKHLNCRNNQLTDLKLSGLTKLNNLECADNQLTDLNLSGLTELCDVDCSNNQLTNLNLKGLTKLSELDCDENQLESLDLSGLESLATVSCMCNRLISVNLDGTTGLIHLWCQYNYLTTWLKEQSFDESFNVVFDPQYVVPLDAEHFPDEVFREYLRRFDTSEIDGILDDDEIMPIINISLKDESSGTGLGVESLKGIEYLKNVQYLDCSNNKIKNLDLRGLSELRELNCENNQLKSLNLSGLMELCDLNCKNNQLTSLNLTGLTELYKLDCENNQLTSIDLTDTIDLHSLYCRYNYLTDWLSRQDFSELTEKELYPQKETKPSEDTPSSGSTDTPAPSVPDTPTPTPSVTPEPTDTPAPSAPQDIEFVDPRQEKGLLERTSGSKNCHLNLEMNVEGEDFTFAYTSSDPDVATVTDDGVIRYQGVGETTVTVTATDADGRTYTREITVRVTQPGQPTFTPSNNISKESKTITVTTSTVRGADGFQVQYSLKNLKKTKKGAKKASFLSDEKAIRHKIKTNKGGVKYYVRVRAYQIVDGKKVYSDWSPVKTIKSRA